MKTKNKKTMKPTELVCEVYCRGLDEYLKEFLKDNEEDKYDYEPWNSLESLNDLKEVVDFGRSLLKQFTKEQNIPSQRELMKPKVKLTKDRKKEIKKAVHLISECEDPKCNLHDEEE